MHSLCGSALDLRRYDRFWSDGVAQFYELAFTFSFSFAVVDTVIDADAGTDWSRDTC